MAKKFIPSLHPRDRFGRFTRSRSAEATTGEQSKAQQVTAGLKPKKNITGAKAGAYLDSFAPDKGRDAVAAYTAGGYVQTHKALRAGKVDEPSVKAMDAAMVDLPDDVMLSRRVPIAVFGQSGPESLVGMHVRDAAYAPTSIGTVRATKTDVRMRISAPRGTRAAVDPESGEVILDRDMDMVVTRVEPNSTGGMDMYVAVLPKTANAPAPAAPAKKAVPAAEPAAPYVSKHASPAGPPSTAPAKAAPAKVQPAKATPAKAAPAAPATSDDDGPDSDLAPEAYRAELMKLRVPELKAMMKERGLKPGKLRKAELVAALAADEYGTEGDPKPAAPKPTTAAPKPAAAPVAPKPAPAAVAPAPASAPSSAVAPAPTRTPDPEPELEPEPVNLTPTEQVQAGDFSGLKRIGPQGGSNPGGLFEAPDGSRWYVKSQKSVKHAQNEVLASTLYRAAGIDTPEVARGSGTPGLDGDWHTASRIVDGAETDVPSKFNNDTYMAEIRSGFAVDAWLGNWDVAGLSYDNIVTGADGKPHRIDLGGALVFRAQGQPKGKAFGPKVSEWLSLRDKKAAPTSSKLFAGISRGEMIASIERIEKVSVSDIRGFAADQYMAEVGDLLVDRRRQLIDMLPKLREQQARAERWNQQAATAIRDQAALDSVPFRLQAGRMQPDVPGWGDDKNSYAGLILSEYQGNLYDPINKGLRGEIGLSDHAKDGIVALDAVMGVSKLPYTTLVYRGFNRPSAIFGKAWNEVDVVGLEWHDKAYASTSVDLRVAEEFAYVNSFANDPPVIMRIVQPAGTPGVRVSDMAPPGMPVGGITFEAEILAPRGQKRRVVADHGIDANGRRIIDVEVIPA